MEYQTIYNKENTRIKFLAFVIIMPAYIDVLNVLLNTIGIGMTSVVTACIYICSYIFDFKMWNKKN